LQIYTSLHILHSGVRCTCLDTRQAIMIVHLPVRAHWPRSRSRFPTRARLVGRPALPLATGRPTRTQNLAEKLTVRDTGKSLARKGKPCPCARDTGVRRGWGVIHDHPLPMPTVGGGYVYFISIKRRQGNRQGNPSAVETQEKRGPGRNWHRTGKVTVNSRRWHVCGQHAKGTQ
jgi:hypothetical protein